MKKARIALMTVLIFILATVGAYAEEAVPTLYTEETPVPVLISIAPQEELRGEYSSYVDGYLEIIVEGVTYPVTVDVDKVVEEVPFTTGTTLGEQLTDLPAHTLIDMVLEKGEASYILVEVTAVHIPMNGPAKEPKDGVKTTVKDSRFNGFAMTFDEKVIEFDVQPQIVDGIVMVPLRGVAEAIGYEVTWNNDTRQVELMMGAKYTAIKIGNNGYFVNRMAPGPLSSAPVIVNNRTLVPVEFVTEILGYGVELEDGTMKIYDEAFTTLTGYISNIVENDDYTMVTVAPRLGDDVEMWETTILIVSDNTVINRAPLAIGDMINGVHLPVMTMSIPGQTGAVVIY